MCFDDKKNCAYNGSAKALDDEGVEALKQWCSHLLPTNYVAGGEVSMCCDKGQVGKVLQSPPHLLILPIHSAVD